MGHLGRPVVPPTCSFLNNERVSLLGRLLMEKTVNLLLAFSAASANLVLLKRLEMVIGGPSSMALLRSLQLLAHSEFDHAFDRT